MTTCKQCREFEKCKDDAFINGAKFDPNECAKYCTDFEQMTNADYIRAMSDEELCKFLGEYKFCDICEEGCDNCTYNGDCNKRLLEWLQQPAE